MHRSAGLWILLVVMLSAVTAYAQPARQPNATDISGEWRLESDEDPGALGQSGQPPLGDYLGIPFNAAGRMRAETSAESIWETPEYSCRPHSAPHQWRGLGGVRILKEQDPLTREIKAYHIQFMRSMDWPVYMDGRPHPPGYAPHLWNGFSTGEWIGNTLKITTTHLKDGYIRRGGPQTSDLYSQTDYLTRHGDILTIVTVTDDPVYLDEPFVQSTTYVADLVGTTVTEVCNGSSSENGGTDRHYVPHFLPGQNTALTEWLKKENWVPVEPTHGGVKTIYPEYKAALAAAKTDSLVVPSSKSAVSPDKNRADQSPQDGEVHILPVQDNIYMLVADGTNITASVGPQGVLLVNTGSAKMTEKLQAAVNQLATFLAAGKTNKCNGVDCPGTWGWASPFMNTVISSPDPPKPLRYIINTSAAGDNVGGNEKLAVSGFFPRVGLGGATGVGRTATIIAHENVLNRMSAPAGKPAPTPEKAWPTDTYFEEFFKLAEYFNGEAVIVYHEPAATTDGDSIVFFRHSEVISAGDIYSSVRYPVIDVDKGGSIQGVIKGLNHILDLAVAEYRGQGGTWVIPSHGRLSDTADVASYRNMLTMIRDRVQDSINKGMTLEQVKASKPTLDFDGRYGSSTGPWTTSMFIEAVYKSLREAQAR
jgi:glyoxylase-like metal-dependent hydrolase (beta-lactamase superfamily II)